ncbi:hypothetical protein LCGC14_1231230 [marine sediment metagenome]|uniref:Uncharacterized protein n=1 Tax=marine sediment metagenome TaxID=412755 RepID=A0A0F9NQP9_9ZZZZ
MYPGKEFVMGIVGRIRSLYFRITRLDIVQVIEEQDEGRKQLDERLDKISQITLNGSASPLTDN